MSADQLARWDRERNSPDRYVVPDGSSRGSLLCRLGLHRWSVIEAIDTYVGPWINYDTMCKFARRVGPKWCPGMSQHHTHREMRWCERCGAKR